LPPTDPTAPPAPVTRMSFGRSPAAPWPSLPSPTDCAMLENSWLTRESSKLHKFLVNRCRLFSEKSSAMECHYIHDATDSAPCAVVTWSASPWSKLRGEFPASFQLTFPGRRDLGTTNRKTATPFATDVTIGTSNYSSSSVRIVLNSLMGRRKHHDRRRPISGVLNLREIVHETITICNRTKP
jgi:hypothetical protein